MRRRDFIKTLVGAASLGPSFAAPAQTAERVRPAMGPQPIRSVPKLKPAF